MSCGCYRKENTAKRGKSNTTHGLTKDPLYKTWRHMVDRCTDENDEAYHHYGGRGIKVCDEWLKSPKNFIRDMGPKPSPYHTLDRKNNDDGYNPNNCRWVTPFEQSRNTRRNIKYLYKGQLYIVADLAKKLNVSAHMLKYRLEQKKMTLEEALSDLYLVKRRRTMSVEPYFIITKYSHFFSVTNIQPSAVGTILKFSAKYVHKTYVRENGKNVLKPNKVFATRIANREFRFHIGQYDDFIKFISYENLTPEYYEVIVKPMYEPASFKSKVNSKFEEREYQTKIIDFLSVEEIGDNRSRLVGLQTGGGKAGTLDSLIKVPGGWKRMGDMQVGDIVSAWDDTPSKVVGVYPQGKQEGVSVTFEDGRTTECSYEHLWTVYLDDSKVALTVNTYELIQLNKKHRVKIPLPKSEDIQDTPLPYEPYTYGKELSYLKKEDQSSYMLPYKDSYTELQKYKNGSTGQRIEFFKGLLTNCKVGNSNTSLVIETKSRLVVETLQYLARSLGGTAYLRETTYVGDTSFALYVIINNPERLYEPKDIKFNNPSSVDTIAVKSIDTIEATEMQCIAIDHPDRLYITDDFIVTHNTFCALSAVSKLTTRTMIVVLGRYMQKWTSDVSEILNVDPKEIIVVQGGEMLKSLMFLSTEQEIQAKFIVVSLTTLQNLYNDFRDNGDGLLDMEFPYLPDELCERLKIGTIIFDEAHQHLYGVYRTLLHTHVPKVIALTATLISDDPFIEYMQHVMFPKEIRYNKVPINKYVKIKSYSYGFKNRDIIKRIRTSTRGSNTYNQIEFEKSLVRIPPLLKSYLDLIVRLVKMDYIDNRLEGDKAMVFAGSIDMCTRITERLKKEFPYLDVRRYVEDDPYENAIEADIRVSTVLSGGTAIDIPNLRTALMTNSIQSPVSNLQALGRLRQLKDRDVTFSYMVNFHIPKQVDYHNRKKELFADRAVSFKELRIDEGI